MTKLTYSRPNPITNKLSNFEHHINTFPEDCKWDSLPSNWPRIWLLTFFSYNWWKINAWTPGKVLRGSFVGPVGPLTYHNQYGASFLFWFLKNLDTLCIGKDNLKMWVLIKPWKGVQGSRGLGLQGHRAYVYEEKCKSHKTCWVWFVINF